MKIRYIHKVKNPTVKVGDEAVVSESVGREFVAGGYAVEVPEPIKPADVGKMTVKYVKDAHSDIGLVGRAGEIRQMKIAPAKQLIANGYAVEVGENEIKQGNNVKENVSETIVENSNPGRTGHKKRTRKRS